MTDINAGAWYLRSSGDQTWQVCEPISGEPRARVRLDPATGEPAADGDEPAATAGAEAVRRFLGLA